MERGLDLKEFKSFSEMSGFLKEIRKKNSKSRAELSRDSGLSLSSIKVMETGDYRYAENIFRWAGSLGFKIYLGKTDEQKEYLEFGEEN